MTVGISLLGVEVLVVTWSAGAALATAGGAVPPASSVGIVGDNAILSWWKTNCHRAVLASMAATVFLTMLVVGLVEVRYLGRKISYSDFSKNSICIQKW